MVVLYNAETVLKSDKIYLLCAAVCFFFFVNEHLHTFSTEVFARMFKYRIHCA